jgi:rfaE bifunctional protein nucleotidyltransferase chain/domain
MLLNEAIEKVRTWKEEGKVVVTSNGTFDILHAAHVHILEEAKKKGDKLIVLLNSDASVKQNKGEKRPIVPEKERAILLEALQCVDNVVIFDEPTPFAVLQQLKPNIHIKGGTFEPKRIKEEKELVESWGGEHVCLPLQEGLSTTNIIDKILYAYQKQ